MQERIKNRKGYYGVKLHQILSFSSIFQKAATFGGEWGFFPGCSMMGYSPELILRVYRWLKKADPSIGLSAAAAGTRHWRWTIWRALKPTREKSAAR